MRVRFSLPALSRKLFAFYGEYNLKNLNMEGKKVERDLMSQEEFENYIYENSGLKNFNAVSMYKSVGRAIKRGHMLPNGMVYPNRPFNNRANTSKRRGVHSRVNNELKKHIYEQLRQYNS